MVIYKLPDCVACVLIVLNSTKMFLRDALCDVQVIALPFQNSLGECFSDLAHKSPELQENAYKHILYLCIYFDIGTLSLIHHIHI